MTAQPHAEDPRLFAVASAIADGAPVDWARSREGTDAATTAVLDELQRLEGLARMNDPLPGAWGPFTITGELGHGTYGTVYRAVDPTLDLEIALKVIRPRTAGLAIDTSRALKEARLLAQVNHPEVVRVYRAELVADEVGISMELVTGHTLHDLVRRTGPMGWGEAISAGLAVCRAMAAVHGARLIHGDIKAQNVMRGDDGRIVLMDFGAGHDLKRAAARAGVGTPLYMAPEVAAGAAPSAASDIYSVGVLLYYLVTGGYPVTGETCDEVSKRHQQPRARRHLRDVRPNLPDAFVRVVEKATAVDVSDRYQSAGALETALERALGGGPNPIVQPWRRRLMLAASVVAAIGLGGLVRSAWITGPPTVGLAPAEAPATTRPGATTPAPETFTIEAGFYKDQNGTEVRLDPGASVAPGDRLSLQIAASTPLHVFVVNEDDQGESYLLFPLPGQGLANPLPANERHRLPGRRGDDSVYWQVTSTGGREHFLVFASPEPPTALARLLESLPRPALDSPVSAQRLPEDALLTLRGVGGLVQKPAGAAPRLADLTAAALLNRREEVSGMWVRELTLHNPAAR